MSKFICIFCDERKNASDAHIINNHIGICDNCYKKLNKTAPGRPFKGYRNISYVISPFEYTSRLRDTILKFKFDNQWAIASLFADMMQEHLDTYGDALGEFDYIVPVPLHKKRFLERGYNQSEMIAKYIADRNGIIMRTDILKRIRATEKQSKLKGINRALNVKDAFLCEENIDGKKIILFDDVCTTGGTLRSCADALADAGAEKICALTLAIAIHFEDKKPQIMY
ncbi:MAG: ComF family protein [Oscillospiraceae bacterium]|nr:ComF family protein [Oscillospiraceae bacterium]